MKKLLVGLLALTSFSALAEDRKFGPESCSMKYSNGYTPKSDYMPQYSDLFLGFNFNDQPTYYGKMTLEYCQQIASEVLQATKPSKKNLVLSYKFKSENFTASGKLE